MRPIPGSDSFYETDPYGRSPLPYIPAFSPRWLTAQDRMTLYQKVEQMSGDVQVVKNHPQGIYLLRPGTQESKICSDIYAILRGLAMSKASSSDASWAYGELAMAAHQMSRQDGTPMVTWQDIRAHQEDFRRMMEQSEGATPSEKQRYLYEMHGAPYARKVMMMKLGEALARFDADPQGHAGELIVYGKLFQEYRQIQENPQHEDELLMKWALQGPRAKGDLMVAGLDAQVRKEKAGAQNKTTKCSNKQKRDALVLPLFVEFYKWNSRQNTQGVVEKSADDALEEYLMRRDAALQGSSEFDKVVQVCLVKVPQSADTYREVPRHRVANGATWIRQQGGSKALMKKIR